MFEKEAEIYALSNFGFRGKNSQRVVTAKIDYQYGAEFGYNKANEWHYVKDGDYPKDNKPVLCILGELDSGNYEVGYYNDVGSGKSWHFETYLLPDDDGDNAWGVLAWQKINPPKLK